jgi:hypothetical protein
MHIKTRSQAIKDGDKLYFTGKPCKHGHISPRFIFGACSECKKQIDKNYKENNKEHIKEYHKKYTKENYSTEKRRQKYIDNVELELYHHAKHRAKQKEMEFNITKDDIIIPERCPVFDIPITFENKDNVPTLDRIDSSKGYIKGNIQVICFKANRLKNNSTIEELKKIISYMELNQNTNNIGLKNGK